MPNNKKSKKKTGNKVSKKAPKEISSPYLDEKDRKAIKFLKKHPVPEEFFR